MLNNTTYHDLIRLGVVGKVDVDDAKVYENENIIGNIKSKQMV